MNSKYFQKHQIFWANFIKKLLFRTLITHFGFNGQSVHTAFLILQTRLVPNWSLQCEHFVDAVVGQFFQVCGQMAIFLFFIIRNSKDNFMSQIFGNFLSDFFKEGKNLQFFMIRNWEDNFFTQIFDNYMCDF